MKRLLLFLLVLTGLLSAAGAEEADALAAVEAAYPGATVLVSAQDEDDAVVVLGVGAQSHKRCGLAFPDLAL